MTRHPDGEMSHGQYGVDTPRCEWRQGTLGRCTLREGHAGPHLDRNDLLHDNTAPPVAAQIAARGFMTCVANYERQGNHAVVIQFKSLEQAHALHRALLGMESQ